MEVFSSGILKVLPQYPQGYWSQYVIWSHYLWVISITLGAEGILFRLDIGVFNKVLPLNHYIRSSNLATLYPNEQEN